jgi:hypothetical protein
MLFARNALASGPQAWFGAEKRLFKVMMGKEKRGDKKLFHFPFSLW